MKSEVTSYISEDQGVWVRPFNCLTIAPIDATDAELEWHIIRLEGLRAGASTDEIFSEKLSASLENARQRLEVS